MPIKLFVTASIALTAVCWGVYGPVLHWGQDAMDHSRLRPFICVGLAYFLVGVLVPGILLYLRGEEGSWTASGTIWSVLAGIAGAIGALGIIMAFALGGRPVYVMPLVFGGAPVVNSLLTMYWSRTFRQVGPAFLAGLMMVGAGAVTVLVFKPRPIEAAAAASQMTLRNLPMVIASIVLVMVCWGAYGPVLHRGQSKMQGSRLRPFICVGLAYFAVAVIVPVLLLRVWTDPGQFTPNGTAWSLAAGAAGALGALGIIFAFDFGGKPIYVMPLVFGGAPVINTFATMLTRASHPPGPVFFSGLILVIVGAAMVLVFAPKAAPLPTASERSEPRSAEPEPAASGGE